MEVTHLDQPFRKNVPAKITVPDEIEERPVAAAPAAPAPGTPPPAPAAPVTKTPQQLKDDELEARRLEVLKSMGWEAPDAPKQEPEVAPVVAAPAAPAAAAPPAPPVKETDAEREARVIATAVKQTVESVAPMFKTAAAATNAAPPAEALDLTPEDKRDLEAVRWMETSDPKFAGKAKEFEKFYGDHYAYQQKWLADNQGKEYDPQAEEHAEFYDKHQPDITPEQIDDAHEEMKFERRFQKRVQPQLDQIQREEAMKKASPNIAKAVSDAAVKLLEGAAPDLAKIVMASGKADFTDATIKAMDEADPVATDVLNSASISLYPVIVELEKTAVAALNYTLDPKNALHAQILDEVLQCEDILGKAPANIQTRAGRQFMTISAMQEAKRAIANSGQPADQQEAAVRDLMAKNWSLSVDDIKETIIDKTVKRAQKEIARQNGIFAKKSGKTGGTQKAAAEAAPVATVPAASSGVARHRPPSISHQGDVVASPGSTVAGPKSFGDTAVETHFGR